MNSRAVSPLIAMVLLVSLTVSAAGLVIVFGTQKTEAITEFANEQLEASETFLDAQLSLQDSSFVGLSDTLKTEGEDLEIVISNPSEETLHIDSVFIVGDGGKEQIAITPVTLLPGDVKTISFAESYDGVMNWIEIIPKNDADLLGPVLKFTPAGFKERNNLYVAYRNANVEPTDGSGSDVGFAPS